MVLAACGIMNEAKKPQSVTLYSQLCMDLLHKALQKVESESASPVAFSFHRRTIHSPSSSEDEAGSVASSSTSTSSSSSEHDASTLLPASQPSFRDSNLHSTPILPEIATASAPTPIEPKQQRPMKKTIITKRQTENIIQQLGTPPTIPMHLDNQSILELPSALLRKHDRLSDMATICRSFLNISTDMLVSQKYVVVLLLRSGRFAGGVFQGNVCLTHRACQRYTTRRGQGKAQSSLDNSKRKANSIGAQLRRAGEQGLREDVANTLAEWRHPFLESTSLILLSCPKTMKKGFFESGATSEFIPRDDERLRNIPLDVGRPTFESVCAVYEIMMQGTVRDAMIESVEAPVTVTTRSETSGQPVIPNQVEETIKAVPIIPLTPLHSFAASGDLSVIQLLLDAESNLEQMIDHRAGEDAMTPLHFAAQSSSTVDPSTAADIVVALLVHGHANPCMVDARNRVPYFLASHEKVRDAFRTARAILGEECWSWDDGAKVGPPLTDEDMEKKKEKAAEKKRRQRARQKENKSKEKAKAEEMAQRFKEEEEKRKQDEDAKRIRDGLKPKASAATNVCDFCQTVCKGKRRAQMYQRLDYAYCSPECVQNHKRELMAAAALSRLG